MHTNHLFSSTHLWFHSVLAPVIGISEQCCAGHGRTDMTSAQHSPPLEIYQVVGLLDLMCARLTSPALCLPLTSGQASCPLGALLFYLCSEGLDPLSRDSPALNAMLLLSAFRHSNEDEKAVTPGPRLPAWPLSQYRKHNVARGSSRGCAVCSPVTPARLDTLLALWLLVMLC
jgi:hypothetical protein